LDLLNLILRHKVDFLELKIELVENKKKYKDIYPNLINLTK